MNDELLGSGRLVGHPNPADVRPKAVLAYLLSPNVTAVMLEVLAEERPIYPPGRRSIRMASGDRSVAFTSDATVTTTSVQP